MEATFCNVIFHEHLKLMGLYILFMIQGLQMGIALPKFLLNIDGASGGIMLLG
jgi:hypothetical protein